MRGRPLLVFTVLFLILTSFNLFAAKGDMTFDTGFDTIQSGDYDQPFGTTAIFEGRCRDANIPKSDSRRMMPLYRTTDSGNPEPETKRIGTLYYNERGQEAVCVDELAMNPLLEKNVRGEMVNVVGLVTLGRAYDLGPDKVLMIESMERLGDMLD